MADILFFKISGNSTYGRDEMKGRDHLDRDWWKAFVKMAMNLCVP